MVSPCSDRISRVPPYSRTLQAFTRTGLSPTPAEFPNSFRFVLQCHWPGPRSLATTCGVSVDVLSCGYLDVSVPRVRFLHPMYSGADTLLTIPRNLCSWRALPSVNKDFRPHAVVACATSLRTGRRIGADGHPALRSANALRAQFPRTRRGKRTKVSTEQIF